jgi:hypothetical protein
VRRRIVKKRGSARDRCGLRGEQGEKRRIFRLVRLPEIDDRIANLLRIIRIEKTAFDGDPIAAAGKVALE